ncbi:MAG: DUF928 domain-containing protein [Myxococcota bacterium]
MSKSITTVILSVILLFAASVGAEEKKTSNDTLADASAEKGEQVSSPPPMRVVYTPPAIGKPAQTVGGGSRGSSDKVPALFVVAPDHVGQTTSAAPSLFWFIDQVPDASIHVEFTLQDEESIEPIVEATLPTPTRAGVQQIQLSDHGAKLAAGIEYQWSIALIVDPDERSKDIVATGFIDRVNATSQLTARLASEGAARSAAVYAEEGIWYDAIAALSEQIAGDPTNAALRQQRADLLGQVGLDQAAKGDAL